jgi:hypothetical protein
MTTTPDQTGRGPTHATTLDSPGDVNRRSASGAGVSAPDAPAVTRDDALRAAKAPVGTGASPLFAQLVALGCISAGVVGVQALLVSLDVASGRSWISSVVDSGDGIDGSSVQVVVAGVVAVVLGVLLLPVVVSRRPRTGLALDANTGVYLRRRDLGRVLEAALDGTASIARVSVRARRRTVLVVATSVDTPDRNAGIETDIGTRVDPVLAALEHSPRLRVGLRNEGS